MPKPHLRVNAFDRVHWQDLAQKYDGCAPNTSYATFISGSEYTLGSICLRRSLLKVGNRCPVDLVFDDRAALLNLTRRDRVLLEKVYGSEHLVPLSSLMANHRVSAARMNYSLLDRSQGKGRRLYQLGAQLYATHSKIWLFALPRSRVVLLDADMVIVGKLDWLTNLPFAEEIAAIDISNRHTRAKDAKFNSGLMVIRPGPGHVRDLTRVALLARSSDGEAMVPKIGERRFGDQSLVNWHFRDSWRALPPSLIRLVHSKLRANMTRLLHLDYQTRITSEGTATSAPGVIHWLGEPKPWARRSGIRIDIKTGSLVPVSKPSPHASLWWQLCREHLQDITSLSSAS